MKTIVNSVVAAVLAVSLSIAVVSASFAQDILEECSGDIEKYCSQVTVGNGRLLACMYAHEDKISDRCDLAIADAADQLDWFLAKVREGIEKCAPDIQKHCADVEAGKGRIFACLKINKSDLEDDCKDVVENVSEQLTSE